MKKIKILWTIICVLMFGTVSAQQIDKKTAAQIGISYLKKIPKTIEEKAITANEKALSPRYG